MVKKIKELILRFKLRRVPEDVCCCGGYVSQGGYPSCPAPCKSAKEYYIETKLKGKSE